MTSARQIEANRRNAQLSTGPRTDEGKRRSRRNAVRHGLTAETVVDALEDANDYAAFEMAVTADFEAQSVVERELILRLASLLWRLRRASAIEVGLFNIQARELLGHRRPRQAGRSSGEALKRSKASEDNEPQQNKNHVQHFFDGDSPSIDLDEKLETTTQSFLRLTHHPTLPLGQLSRYEAILWRQACQILWTLQCLDRRKPWERSQPPQVRF
jgi:hypothetical protein